MEKTNPPKDLGEYLDGAPKGEGVKKTLTELLGQRITITALQMRTSKYNEPGQSDMYLNIQAMLGEEHIYINTSASVILDQSEQIKSHLPGDCIIEQRRSKEGRDYFILSGCRPSPPEGKYSNYKGYRREV